MVALSVLIGIFVGNFFQMNAFQRVVGSETEVGDLLGGNTADGHLHVGSHARRGFEFVLSDETDFVVVTDGVSLAEVDYVDACHNGMGMG